MADDAGYLTKNIVVDAYKAYAQACDRYGLNGKVWSLDKFQIDVSTMLAAEHAKKAADRVMTLAGFDG